MNKEELKQYFAKDFKTHYEVQLFKERGFARKTCITCNKNFWTLDQNRNDCGDSAHTEYSFFKDKPLEITYIDFWKKFQDFFVKNGHTPIPRYPVAAKWRDDLYFNVASIVDFQRIENGKMLFEYPANPLVVPQVCLRFPDIANVGVTGRHLTSFTMAGQHSFNYPKEGYWKDECIRLNFEFLTKVMNIKETDINYSEDVWNMPDFSAFGPSIEAFANGVELVNSVFMQYYLFKDEIKELQMKVIDVGWGLERLLWYMTGKPTVYDATFPNQIEFIKKQAGVKVDEAIMQKYKAMSAELNFEEVANLKEEKRRIAGKLGITLEQMNNQLRPLQATYSIADHARTLLFALTDGALPSNMAGGYNLRVILRRAMSFNEECNLNVDLMGVVEMHAQELKPMFPELSDKQNLKEINEILNVEKRKFEDTKVKSRSIIVDLLKRKEQITTDKLITLYQSNGITPETIERIAKEQSVDVDIPAEFYSKITEKHVLAEKGTEDKLELVEDILNKNIAKTASTYYKDNYLFEAKAKVLYVNEKFNAVVTDQTIFYPEGGGQLTDQGTINGNFVEKVEKKGGVIIHFLKTLSNISINSVVDLRVDKERRSHLQLHHSGAHILIQACQRILGRHVWQSGSRKDVGIAHIDITHYEKPSREQVEQIEQLANKVIREGHTITPLEVNRLEAEKKYSFRIYQGGGAPSNVIRLIKIEEFDIQACGGIHATNTYKLGIIKVVKTDQIQDGLIRIYFKSAIPALNHVENEGYLLEDSAAELSVPKEELRKTVRNIFEKWRESEKKLEKAQELLVDVDAAKIVEYEVEKQGDNLKIEREIPQSNQLVEKLAVKIINDAEKQGKKATAAIFNKEKFLTISSNFENAVELLKKYNAKGGGNNNFARGKIQQH